MTVFDFVSAVSSGRLDSDFSQLYGGSDREILRQRTRFLSISEQFSRLFPERNEIHIFSVPFCTGIAGNSVSGQHGTVISSAVSRDIIAVAGFHNDKVVRICLEGHEVEEIKLSDIANKKDETETIGSAVLRIISEALNQGMQITGFDIFISSDIPEYDIISPASAFEVLILSVIESLCEKYPDITGYSGDRYISEKFLCRTGGIVSAGFENPETLQIQKIESDIYSSGYSLCAVRICDCSEIKFSEYTGQAVKVKNSIFTGYANESGLKEISALKRNDLNEFFRLVNEWGFYSAYLCDICSVKSGSDNIFLPALTASRKILNGCGASQICVKDSVGIVQAFVPSYMVKRYICEMEKIFGKGSCCVFSLRKTGATEIKI
ncbi:MAG: hypothetical protein K2I00_10430 [Ruminococcus sp.]|nr:hypothetical protein [Ruminococcus sp.]